MSVTHEQWERARLAITAAPRGSPAEDAALDQFRAVWAEAEKDWAKEPPRPETRPETRLLGCVAEDPRTPEARAKRVTEYPKIVHRQDPDNPRGPSLPGWAWVDGQGKRRWSLERPEL